MTDRGADLTRAEQFRLRVRRQLDLAKDHYRHLEDLWTENHLDSWERTSQYRLALDAERAGEGELGRAYRTWQRLRHWAAVANLMYNSRRMAYYDDARMGTGG